MACELAAGRHVRNDSSRFVARPHYVPGPRDLTSDGIYRSQMTALVNAEVGYRMSETWRLSAEFLNLLDRRDHDIDYAYESRITPTTTPAFTDAFHPIESIQVRFGLRGTF